LLKKQIKNLDSIGKEFTNEVNQFPGYKQELVFKVKTLQNVNEKEFRSKLQEADCETVISTPGKNAEWIVATSDSKFTRLKDKINARAERENPNFVDWIADFKGLTFRDKKGERLIKAPYGFFISEYR